MKCFGWLINPSICIIRRKSRYFLMLSASPPKVKSHLPSLLSVITPNYVQVASPSQRPKSFASSTTQPSSVVPPSLRRIQLELPSHKSLAAVRSLPPFEIPPQFTAVAPFQSKSWPFTAVRNSWSQFNRAVVPSGFFSLSPKIYVKHPNLAIFNVLLII